MNELLLVVSLIAEYAIVLAAYRFFGTSGLYVLTSLYTVAANIEVMIVVRAFGVEQTLGNILFASLFLITDVLSENEGKKAAERAVYLGMASTVIFLLISRTWLLYSPSENDAVSGSIRNVFDMSGRVMISSVAVYIIVQKLDVWLYHAIWRATEKRSGEKKSFLWLRNNGATLISQAVNTVLFNVLAFYGTFPAKTIISMCAAGYAVFVVTSLCDTPFVYLSRRLKANKNA